MRPTYCGGFTDVAKGLWMCRENIDVGKPVDYALRLEFGAVIRRFGYLLETFEMCNAAQLERLRRRLTASYAILDPLLLAEGGFISRCGLRFKVKPGEIDSVART